MHIILSKFFNNNIVLCTLYLTILFIFIYFTNCNLLIYNNVQINFNLSLLTNLTLLWVNNNFVFVFFLLILFYTSSLNLIKTNVLLISLILMLLFNCNILNFNMVYQVTDNTLVMFNNLLINKINVIHPPLLYLSGVRIIMLSINLFLKFNPNSLLFKSNYQVNKITNIIIVLVITIILGAFWAIQEGTWGGWWAWDPSELLSLSLFITLLILLHKFNSIYNSFSYNYKTLFLVILLISHYLFIQLNFKLTSHNFGNINNFFKENYLYLDILIIWILLYFLLKLKSNNYIGREVTNLNVINLLLTFLVVLVYLYSNIDLVFYWCFNYFNLEFNLNIPYIQTLLILTLIIFTFKNIIFVNIFLITLCNSITSFFLGWLCVVYNFKCSILNLHILILLIFYYLWLDNNINLNVTLNVTNNLNTTYKYNLIVQNFYQSTLMTTLNAFNYNIFFIEAQNFSFYNITTLFKLNSNAVLSLYLILSYHYVYLNIFFILILLTLIPITWLSIIQLYQINKYKFT